MEPLHGLTFEPSTLREQCWVTELPDRRYTISKSHSGFAVSFQYICAKDPGETPAPERLRHLFTSFDDASRACCEHYKATTN